MATLVSAPSQQAHHIDSFDGIRGIAVLMVLLRHAGCFFTGWAGVDIFFVLSGFLITGILRTSRAEPCYWRRFYIKRATRILPPLFLGIAATALLWPHSSLIGIGGYLLSLGNVVDMTRLSIVPLEHLWSLSVEEHYYLFWPLAVLWLPRRTLQWLLLALVIIVPLSRVGFTFLLTRQEPYAIYLLTPFRIDGLALGSLLSLLLEQGGWQERFKKWSGLGAALASAVYLGLWKILGSGNFSPEAHNAIFNGIAYSLLALIAMFVIAYARLQPAAIPTRILRNRVLTKLGVISYGLYVYSWIELVLIKRSFASLSWLQAGLIHLFVAVPLAAVLFKYYERPITNWGRRRAAQLAAKAKPAANDNAPDTEGHAFEVEAHRQPGIVVT
jgi:peptidoglycan/LPS O-acetylase OafA/YrhL